MLFLRAKEILSFIKYDNLVTCTFVYTVIKEGTI